MIFSCEEDCVLKPCEKSKNAGITEIIETVTSSHSMIEKYWYKKILKPFENKPENWKMATQQDLHKGAKQAWPAEMFCTSHLGSHTY